MNGNEPDLLLLLVVRVDNGNESSINGNDSKYKRESERIRRKEGIP